MSFFVPFTVAKTKQCLLRKPKFARNTPNKICNEIRAYPFKFGKLLDWDAIALSKGITPKLVPAAINKTPKITERAENLVGFCSNILKFNLHGHS